MYCLINEWGKIHEHYKLIDDFRLEIERRLIQYNLNFKKELIINEYLQLEKIRLAKYSIKNIKLTSFEIIKSFDFGDIIYYFYE